MHPLWQHQIDAIRLADKTHQDLGLFFEQGTGKTRTMIEILRREYAAKGRIRRTLIICPIVVCNNWKAEFKQYSKIAQDKIVVLHGSGKNRQKQMEKVLTNPDCIVVTNFETLQMKEVFAQFELWQVEILIIDESQRIKSPTSARAKQCVKLADQTARNFILSGTPILDGKGMDIYMQFRVLDRGVTFGTNFFAFRARYFYDKNSGMNKNAYFPKWVPHPSAFKEFNRKIENKSLRVLKKDCLDLPPLVRQIIPVELSKEQTTAYREMYNECITFLKDNTDKPKAVVAQLALTKTLRLQQIVSGFVKDEDGTVHRLPCPRINVLEDLLNDLCVDGEHKVIVWATFKENYLMIQELCDKLKLTYRTLTGDTPPGEREINMREFRQDPDVKVMIANQGAGGVGVNLIEASYSIYYSKGFKLEDDLQSEARNYRGGSEIHEKVTRIDLVAPRTVDELVTEALHNKQEVSIKILGDY